MADFWLKIGYIFFVILGSKQEHRNWLCGITPILLIGGMIMNKSAALYCRLSKDDLSFGESSSISTQKMILRKYAQMKNWTIYDIYVDDGWAGANFDRPGFKRMIADVEAGHISIVEVKDTFGL